MWRFGVIKYLKRVMSIFQMTNILWVISFVALNELDNNIFVPLHTTEFSFGDLMTETMLKELESKILRP